MADIYLAIGIICVFAAALLVVGVRIAARLRRRWALLVAGLTVLGLVIFRFTLQDHTVLLRLLPFSSAIVLANWVPLFAGLLAGLAWRLIPGKPWRKCITIVPLLALCLYKSYTPVLEPQPEINARWDDGVCMQSSPSSCSAACAATLLKAHGIDATEEEMARLCRTRKVGTLTHGLFRGLKIKTRGTPYTVQARRWSFDQLRDNLDGPAIIVVGLDKGAGADPIYENQYGWVPGVYHTVVLFGFLGEEQDRVEIGDPSIGRERWHVESIHVLWSGEILRLVKRNPDP